MSGDNNSTDKNIKEEPLVKEENEPKTVVIKQEPPGQEEPHDQKGVLQSKFVVKEELIIEFEQLDEPEPPTAPAHNEPARKNLLSHYSKSYDTWLKSKSEVISRNIDYLPVNRPIRTYSKPKDSKSEQTGSKLNSDSGGIQVKRTPKKQQIDLPSNESPEIICDTRVGSPPKDPLAKKPLDGPPVLPSHVFICHICNEWFSYNILLKQHQTRAHADKQNKEFTSEGDISKKKLRESAKIHRTRRDEKPFKCSNCKKYFSQKSSLNEHMCYHLKKKPHLKKKMFSCGKCNKPFKHRSNLKYHQRTDVDAEMFTCNKCKKEFTLKCLKYHLRTHREPVVSPPEVRRMPPCITTTYPECVPSFGALK